MAKVMHLVDVVVEPVVQAGGGVGVGGGLRWWWWWRTPLVVVVVMLLLLIKGWLADIWSLTPRGKPLLR